MSGSTSKKKGGEPGCYPITEFFVEWLESGMGRAAYFARIDPLLTAPLLSKMKTGAVPISFEYAFRLERAQKASKTPFKAVDIMTFEQDRALYRYAIGKEPAPAQLVTKRAQVGRPRKDAAAGAGA